MPDAASRPRPAGAWRRWLGQAALYGLFALAIGTFSHWPPYRHLEPGQALIKLSISHVGKPVGDCRRLSDAELARLPPNMRAPTECPRQRSPLTVEVDLGGVAVLRRSVPPSGLSGDGASAIYERLVVPAGEQQLAVRLSDDVRARDTPYRRAARVTLAPGQVLVIDFDAGKGGITFQ